MLSRKARSALTAMLDVARLARGRPLSAKALTSRDGMAVRQLEAVLQDLVRGGLLRSVRGPRGGYELGRERRRITAGDIVRTIDRPDAPMDGDAVDDVVAGATAAFLAHLDAISLEDLCGRASPVGAAEGADFHI